MHVEDHKGLTRNSSGDEIPKCDIALFCYPSCI